MKCTDSNMNFIRFIFFLIGIFIVVSVNAIDVLQVCGKTPYSEEAQAIAKQFAALKSEFWNFQSISGSELLKNPGVIDRYDVVIFGREHNTWENAALSELDKKLEQFLNRGGLIVIDSTSNAANRWFSDFSLAVDLKPLWDAKFVFQGENITSKYDFPNSGLWSTKQLIRSGDWQIYGDKDSSSFFCAIREVAGGMLVILPRFTSTALLENLAVYTLMKRNAAGWTAAMTIPNLYYGKCEIAADVAQAGNGKLVLTLNPAKSQEKQSLQFILDHSGIYRKPLVVGAEGIASADLEIFSADQLIYRKKMPIVSRPLLYLYAESGIVDAGSENMIYGIIRSTQDVRKPLVAKWQLLSSANGTEFASGTFDITSDRFSLAIKPDGHLIGLLKVKITIIDDGVEAVADCVFKTVEHGNDGPAISFRQSDQTMLIDGQPFFPIWGSRVDNAQLPEMEEMGFNFITDMKQFSQMGSQNYQSGDEIRAGQFLSRYGMKKMAMLNWKFSSEFGKNHGGEFGESLRAEVPLWRNDSNVLINYLMDEPPPSTMMDVAAGYRLLKAVAPKKPVAVCINHMERAEVFSALKNTGKFTDIIMVDPYPYPYRGIDKIYQQIDLARELTGNRLPVMGLVPAFAYSTDRNKKDLGRYPTRDELRLEVYLSLAHGVRGLGFFTMTWLDIGRIDKSRPAFWNALRQVLGEIKVLTPVLLSEEHIAGGKYGDLPLHYYWAKYGDDGYLIVVNSSHNNYKVKITSKCFRPNEAVEEFFENRLLFPENTAIVDDFLPLGVHIYKAYNIKTLDEIELSLMK